MNEYGGATTIKARAAVDRIEAGLQQLIETRRPGEAFTLAQIARACDCGRGTIFMIEQRALKKVRKIIRQQYGVSWETFVREGRDLL